MTAVHWQSPILITGCARSGTSLTASIIHASGAFGGVLSGSNTYNRRGMFENRGIRKQLIKPFLRSINADPLGQNPLPDLDLVRRAVERGEGQVLAKAMRKRLYVEGYRGGPWFYKGAKMCLIWPLFNAAFPGAEWIIVRREENSIIESCLRTGFMHNCHGKEGWSGWVQHHLARFEEMWSAMSGRIRDFWPDVAVRVSFDRTKRMVDELGLHWNLEKVRGCIDPSLWHEAH